MKKWDFAKREFIPYNPPNTGHYSYFETDVLSNVHCPHCGKETWVGFCYISKEIFDNSGTRGYYICPRCCEKELDDYLKEWRRVNHEIF